MPNTDQTQYLVELFLPLFDNQGHRFPDNQFDQVFTELTERFGGVTAFQRSPAEGSWQAPGGDIHFDQMIVYEVMVSSLDRGWWQTYRQELESRFHQQQLLVRLTQVETL